MTEMDHSASMKLVDEALEINSKLGFQPDESKSVLFDDMGSLKKKNPLMADKYHDLIVKAGLQENPRQFAALLISAMKEEDKMHPGYLPESVKSSASKKKQTMVSNILIYSFLTLVAFFVFYPVVLVFYNSIKSGGSIALDPLNFPNADSFVGVDNFKRGIVESSFGYALFYSLYITVVSTIFILLFCSMTAWFITRVKTWWTKLIYFVILFSQVVPFQLVMLPMNQIASDWHLNTWYLGIIIIYVGFGAGLSVFMYSGFVKSVPLEIEEAAMIDGCNPLQTFFKIVFPILKPTTITIAILNVMWIWNDYLLPSMILGSTIDPSSGKATTIPVAIQMVANGSYGSIDYGMMMAMIVLTIIPVVIFYLFGQKYIIKGVTAGAVKG